MPLGALFLLCFLALLPLQGAFQEAGVETVTLVEGQSLDLDCAVAGDGDLVLEWKDPRWFVIFFQDLRGLKDQRYKLVHHSKDGLHVRLSHVTTEDEGLYTCFRNSVPFKRKQVNVLALPSSPLLEASRIRVQGREEKLVLKCSVWGSKPPSQITWLLDNGMELFGDTKHQLQGRGKKYNSTSTLTVHTYNQKSAVTCVIRHKSLRGGNLTTNFHLKLVGSGNILSGTEGHSHSEKTTPRYEIATPNYSTIHGSDQILNATDHQTPSPNNATATLVSNVTNESGNVSSVTEGLSHLQTSFLTSREATWDSKTTSGADLTYEEMVERTPNVLFPILVSALLTALFITVLLFVVKLWKAHKAWKKESEASEQTLENNRPRTNEDNLDQEKKIRAACWKVSKKYVIQSSCTKTSKDSEESQDSSVFEKQLPDVKEMDL